MNRIDPYGLFDNPLPKLPTFTESAPNSTFVAPVGDIVTGGIELGFAVTIGVASMAGPEAWWIPILYGGAAVETGNDALSRITTGINGLSNNSSNASKCR